MKKGITLLLAAIIVLSLTACSGTAAESFFQSDTPVSETPSETMQPVSPSPTVEPTEELVEDSDVSSEEPEAVSESVQEPVPMADSAEPPANVAPAGIRPEFKEAMDSYEAFFDEYIEFMETYESSNNSMEMLLDYTKYMAQYAETMEKLDEIGEEEMSDEELAYYTETMLRINEKLLATAQ